RYHHLRPLPKVDLHQPLLRAVRPPSVRLRLQLLVLEANSHRLPVNALRPHRTLNNNPQQNSLERQL
ncbi:MAG: hypothetical protein AB2693_12685, partial [Candidatus Thiodiazotropha sp.]